MFVQIYCVFVPVVLLFTVGITRTCRLCHRVSAGGFRARPVLKYGLLAVLCSHCGKLRFVAVPPFL